MYLGFMALFSLVSWHQHHLSLDSLRPLSVLSFLHSFFAPSLLDLFSSSDARSLFFSFVELDPVVEPKKEGNKVSEPNHREKNKSSSGFRC